VVSGGALYVADTGNKRIVRFDAEGKVAGQWGGAGNAPGQFVEPVGLAADAAGKIYVADTGNHRIQVFERDGAFLRQFPVYGWKDFYTEPYIAIGPSESVFATDSWKSRIAQYDAQGNLRKAFSAVGMKSPTGIVLDPFGRLVVSDRGQNRVTSWSLSELLN
jgi:sugar lactone lactonase YvrE